ncbi:hypothetical protein ACJ72_03367 [Emergomyces africanus]|uniref:Pre-rRNA-processing protein ESF2 n=1 Tax=Emergomyces africanus TaxID=1955775 RepID=A0A1B7NZU0_9EURO|nr:hypothetical protein ACJ72_03367 [Emergomyces africanus]
MDYSELLGISPSDDDGTSDCGNNFKQTAVKSKGNAVKRSWTAQSRDSFDLQSNNPNSDNGDSDKQSRTDLAIKRRKINRRRTTAAWSEDDDDDEDEVNATDIPLAPSTNMSLGEKPKALKKTKNKKKGVIYFSSLPPYLKPGALKNLLETRGFEPITRIFLTPLPSNDSRQKGNKRKMYSDGWVEFASKKTAKLCAASLNARTVGGRGYYRDDLLNVKYLHKFGWADLMEQVQRERSEREARKRIDDAQARKEQKMYLEGVEAGRAAHGMARKREKKQRCLAPNSEEDMAAKASIIRRRFVQNHVILKEKARDDSIVTDSELKNSVVQQCINLYSCTSDIVLRWY